MKNIKGLDFHKKDSIIVICTESECHKNKFNICCKCCDELSNCIEKDLQCSDIELDIADCSYARY